MKKISFILGTFLVFGFFVSVAPQAVSAATVFSDGFTAGSDPDDISGWDEEGTDNDSSTIPQSGAISGEDQASPQGDLFAKIGEDDWICRTIDTSGHVNLFLHYFWRGDADAEDGESGFVEYRTSGSCSSVSGWTNIATHEIDDGNNNIQEAWSSMQSIDLPDSLDNSSFILRFRQSTSDSNEYFRVDGVLVKGDRLGNIAVRKVVTSPTKDKFDFTSNVEGSDNFSLGGGEKHKLGNLVEGVYTITEDQKDGYVLTGIYCDDETAEINLETGTATVNVSLYEDVTCTFTNEPIQLIVKKVFVGDENGDPTDFGFTVNKQGQETPIAFQFEADGENFVYGLPNGAYDVVEDSEPGYTATYSSNRPGENANHCENIDVDSGNGPHICTITNSKLPTLTVIKHVVNDNEGTSKAGDFSLIVNGVDANPAGQFPGSETGTLVILGVGPYGVAESIAQGYGVPTFSADCSGNMELGDKKTCTVTNDDLPPPQACVPEINLLANSGFESPDVVHGAGWDVFSSGTLGLDWIVNWRSAFVGAPEIAKLELHGGVNGWLPNSGSQYAELDTDWDGPSGIPGPEQSSVSIYQNVPTVLGETYTLSYNFSPRPGANSSQNVLEVYVDGLLKNTHSASGAGQTSWTPYSLNFTGTGALTKIEFRDGGTPDSVGTFLDDVSLVCTPKQTPCEEVLSSQTLVSDDTTLDGDGNASELTFVHPAWTASIPDATWIWATDPVEAPTNDGDLTKVFTKTFTVVGTPTSGTLDVASDNSYSVELNGNSLPVVFDQNNFQLATQDSYDVSSLLVSGPNTLEITVTNWESAEQSADPASNPAGLLYKLSLNENACVPPPPQCDDDEYLNEDNQCVPNYPDPTTATIYATKIVCDSEDDLPNWGEGGADISSATVSNFLADDLEDETQDCRISPWTFEWAPNGTSNPGDSVEAGGGAWTSFTTSAVVPVGSLVWVREQFDSNYISFSGDVTPPRDQNVSAEFYCSNDVLNYDNYDFIDPVVAGENYYCVGFNVLEEEVVYDACPDLQGNQNSTEECQPPQNPPQCSDGVDNGDEEDSLIDMNDQGCESPSDNDETDPFNPSSHSGSFAPGGSVAGAFTGQVLGESCGLYMDRFVRFGSSHNDVEQVKLLQAFLNKWMGSNLPLSGVYGPQTLEVLKAFQEKYASEVLTPWNLNGPTGLVYQTTLRWINMLECPDLALQLPELIEWSKNPNVPKEPLATSLPVSDSGAPAINNEDENTDEEGDEGLDLESLPASVGESESGGGFLNFLKNLFGN